MVPPPLLSRGCDRPGDDHVYAPNAVTGAGSEAAGAYLAAHTVSIRELVTLTGISLLPRLDAEALKRAVASELWPRS